MPRVVERVVGAEGVQEATEGFVGAFQSAYINKHLLFTALDLVVKDILEQV